MPILVPKGLPAYDVLKNENVFVMTDQRASVQDIRPLSIAIVNLMPTLEVTETQLIRMLANTPLQVELSLLMMDTHEQKKSDIQHLETFYHTYDEIKRKKFDGMIITGAPVEKLSYEQVDYWEELESIMDYTKKNVFSTLHICWGAQAGLYHHYGIDKYMLEEKLFGVFPHNVKICTDLTRGFDDVFYVPHSRHSQVKKSDIEAVDELLILADSEQAGAHLVCTKNERWIFLQGHVEYDRETLKKEYDRDVEKGLGVGVPFNYFIDDDPSKGINMSWKGHGNLFYANWLNFVYQRTPFDLNDLETMEW
ncbi:MAG: homoserine O-succinyltransferase [Firmicutes bacterium]|nr:homoserine O-succinyltransferase [Bacillota bacterium]